jgi:murein DD-endopeptidase MepM/ murein hydrolase activator NlpD
MSWWQQPFTLMYVPHDGRNARSLTLKRLTFVTLLFLGAFFVSTGVLVSLFGLRPAQPQSVSSTAQANQLTTAQNGSSRTDLRQTIKALRQQLKTTRTRQRAVMKIAGLKAAQPEGSDAPKDLKGWSENGDRVLKSAIKRNRKLQQVKKFVESRHEVFRHTPTLWPTEGWMSSPYGYRKDPMGGQGKSFHEGVDIAAWHGNPVRSTATGEVVFSGRKTGYGHVVEVEHEYGYRTVYGHLSERLVEVGDVVRKGTAVGRVGNTGRSTGSHVHYEVRVNGDAINPWPYLVEEFTAYRQYAMKGASE